MIVVSLTTIGEMAMPKQVHQRQFSIIGIEARTTNAKEMSNQAVIGKQWQRFFQEQVLQKIPDKADPNIYAVYTDYATDRSGEYSFVIGAKVNQESRVPPGMVLKTVPAGNYAVITSDKGPVDKVVVAAWQQIWALEDKAALGGRRAYRADFEIYQRAADPQNSQVDIYVGLK